MALGLPEGRPCTSPAPRWRRLSFPDLNPQPVVTSATPNPVNTGSAAVTINGTGFARGATVYFAGAALATTFVSRSESAAGCHLRDSQSGEHGQRRGHDQWHWVCQRGDRVLRRRRAGDDFRFQI